MSPGIVVADRAESQWHGTLLATVEVSTAMAPLAMTFDDPNYEYRTIRRVEASRMGSILPKERKELKSLVTLVNTLILKNVKSDTDLIEVLLEKRLDECTKTERALRLKAARFFTSKEQGEFKDILHKHLGKLGLERSQGPLLEPPEISTVHLKFQNLKEKDMTMILDGESSGQSPERHYDQDKGIVTLTCTSGPDVLESSRANPLSFADKEITTCINMIIADGFGDLTNRVSARMTDEDCKFFWKDELILESRGIIEKLEHLRDAALWIWLRALNEQYNPTVTTEPGSATLTTEPDSATVTTEPDSAMKTRWREFAQRAADKVQRGRCSPILTEIAERNSAAAKNNAFLEPVSMSQLETMSPEELWVASLLWKERLRTPSPGETIATWPQCLPPFEKYLKTPGLVNPKFPDVPGELKDLVSRLEERGMLEEAKDFVGARQLFVQLAKDKGEKDRLILLSEMGSKSIDPVGCLNTRDWMWYGKVLKLFTEFLGASHLEVVRL